jgi:thioredoxin 1
MAGFNDIIRSRETVLVDFSAEWCGPCKMMKPILEELKSKMGEKVTILKVDVDKNPKVAAAYKIQGVPTLILFQNGAVTWRKSGVVQARDLQTIIQQNAKAHSSNQR